MKEKDEAFYAWVRQDSPKLGFWVCFTERLNKVFIILSIITIYAFPEYGLRAITASILLKQAIEAILAVYVRRKKRVYEMEKIIDKIFED